MKRDKAFFVDAAKRAMDQAHAIEREHRTAGSRPGPTKIAAAKYIAESECWRHAARAISDYAQAMP